MNIIFHCQHCSQLIQTDSIASFFSFRCPKCDNVISVPKEGIVISQSIVTIPPAEIISNREYNERPAPKYSPHVWPGVHQEPRHFVSDGYCQ